MRYFYFLFLMFLTVGCVTTDFFSKLNPQYPGTQYQRILIYFMDAQPDYAEYGEKATQQEILKVFGSSIQCYLFSKEFFVTGLTLTNQMKIDMHNFEIDKNVDAVILCSGSRGVQEKRGWVTNNGIPMYQNDDQNVVGYRMELFDLRAQKSVWYSSTKSSGNAFLISNKELIDGFIQRSVSEMQINQLLGMDTMPAPFATPIPQNQSPVI